MTIKELFKDWSDIIDSTELYKTLKAIKDSGKKYCPESKNIFKAFELCSYNDCVTVFIGSDPYPQKGIATGILFGNSKDTKILSPSLEIIKEAAINYTIPHNPIEFDITLESWAKQGILMINSAFTCEVNKVGSHFTIWEPFVSKFLTNLSNKNPSLIYVLFGTQASSFKKYISQSADIIEVYHPAYYVRMNKRMPSDIFTNINKRLEYMYGLRIEFYKNLYNQNYET